MFKNAIKKNLDCVKPMATAYKTPYSDELVTNMFSLFLINKDGWALTTKSVANNIILAENIHNVYDKIKTELLANKVPPKKIYKKYKIKDNDPVILKNVFLNTLDSWTGLKIYVHEYLDLALIKFENPEGFACSKFPVFAKHNPVQGEYLCRLGFPYPEFSAFRYDYGSKDLVLNRVIEYGLQVFPIDGMLTRYVADEKKNLTLFELSNQAFIGHAGGPIINTNGEIVGIQMSMAYKDAYCDINANIKRDHHELDIKQYNFIPLSLCINVETIKEFLDKYNVEYETK